MNNVACLGNSHVACMKVAWDDVVNSWADGVAVTFFAGRGKEMANLEVVDHRLVPQTEKAVKSLEFTSGGSSVINTVQYEYFILCGLGLKLHRWPSCYYSEYVVREAVKTCVMHSTAGKILHKLRRVSDRPVFVVPDPLPSVGKAIEDPIQSFQTSKERLAKFLNDEYDAKLICQPETSLGAGFFTNPRYSVGSRRLSIGKWNDEQEHPEEDVYHMNMEFGKRIWHELIDEMKIA